MLTVFLDFDGVLFDTLREAFVLCRFAYFKVDVFEDIDETFYKNFYKYKFLVYKSWQYYYLMKVLTEFSDLDENQVVSVYYKLLENRNIKKEEEFDNLYLSKRVELMENYVEYWNTLENPFPFFFDIKNLYLDKKIEPIIVSQKNSFSIKHRLYQYGLHIQDTKIYGKEELLGYKTKLDFIGEYLMKRNIKKSVFVDDNSNNFRKDRDNNIEQMLAGWGNIGLKERGFSREEMLSKIEHFMLEL